MFYIVQQFATSPGRFEHRFWCQFNGTVGSGKDGWSNARSYAMTFTSREAAEAFIAANRRAIGDRGYATQMM